MADLKEEWLNRTTDRLGIAPEDVIEIAGMFFETVEEHLDGIAAADQSGDIEIRTRLAHSIKGDAANMGFTDIYQLARELERQSKACAVVNLDEQLEALRAATFATRESLGL